MKNTAIYLLALATLFLSACNGTSDTKTDQTDVTGTTTVEETPAANGDLYFDFTVDGKPMHMDAADVRTTYAEAPQDTVFRIYAGKDGGPTLLLTIPQGMSRPSTTPSGSNGFNGHIAQGSVSLVNYPEKNYTSNNFNMVSPATSVPVPGAVVVTASERLGDEARIITGTINTKTFGGENTRNDPNIKDRVIKGRFRLKHVFSGYKF